jgi:hypothetical protein
MLMGNARACEETAHSMGMNHLQHNDYGASTVW